jgi:hypothetical protein
MGNSNRRGDYSQYGGDTMTDDYSVNDCPRGKLAFAEKLTEKLEFTEPIPDDFDPTGYAPPILADLRHNFMNYDDVWGELWLFCVECTDSTDQPAPCTIGDEDGELWQDRDRMAYWIIKWAANDLARDVICEAKQKLGITR